MIFVKKSSFRKPLNLCYQIKKMMLSTAQLNLLNFHQLLADITQIHKKDKKDWKDT